MTNAITGYHKPTESEIELANNIKKKESEFGEYINHLRVTEDGLTPEQAIIRKQCVEEAAIKMKEASMWLCRGVFLPTTNY